jgi:hypothetical protein
MTEITRKSILAEAEKCVCTSRQEEYGSIENNFSLIARLWREYLDTDKPITAHDVAMMMALLKVARIASGQTKEDNYVDLAGYAACAGEIALHGVKEGEWHWESIEKIKN